MSLLGLFVARLLEGIFVIGSIGSLLVFVLSGIEDIKTLFGPEEDENHT